MSASPEFANREHRPSLHSLPLPPGLERGRDGQYADDYVARQRMEEYHAGHSSRSPVFNSRPYDNGNKVSPSHVCRPGTLRRALALCPFTVFYAAA